MLGSSSTTSSGSSDTESTEAAFPFFMRLPPEIRYQIYYNTIPSPGINFLNVHSFPNDHPGANRSTSPPELHLDLRRLSIEDDDETVAKYDPSVWQVRYALRQTCREARQILAIPDDKILRLTLSIPRKGLFTRAGDSVQRSATPLSQPLPEAEATVYRQIELHADDVVCLSVENCSFNMVFEESTMFHIGRDEDEDEVNLGWAYDPQFKGVKSLGIPKSKVCVGLARDEWAAMQAISEVAAALFESATTEGATINRNLRDGFIMFDAEAYPLETLQVRFRYGQLFHDRWGDKYFSGLWHDDLPLKAQLIKVLPEKTQVRTRYLRSALLQSPKRPA